MLGFVDYKIDAVVKFGGSLLEDEHRCKAAIDSLAAASQKGYRILVVPGGGPTDNAIEKLDRTYHFVSNTHHKACARAQDQTGIMICDEFFSTSLCPCENLEDVAEVLDNGKVAVILPSRIIFDMNPFERTWDITSDAMAAWFAWVTSAKRFIIFKSIDGIFEVDEDGIKKDLIKTISADTLMQMNSDVVDKCVAPFLLAKKMNAYIVNGNNQDDFLKIFDSADFHGTFVIGDSK